MESKIFFLKYPRPPRQQGLPTACATSKGDGSWSRGGQGGQSQGDHDDADEDDGHMVGDDYWGGQGGQSQGADEDDGHLVSDEDDLVDDDYCDCQEGEGEGDKIRWSLVLETCSILPRSETEYQAT